MSEQITLAESSRLVDLERVIEKGLSNFIAVGEALMEIRDSRLYRIEHATFEDYCRDEWEMSKSYCTRLIQTSEVARNLVPIGTTPQTESQARPLIALKEPEQQREAWSAAVAAAPNGKPTARDVAAAAEQVKSKTRPIPDVVLTDEAKAAVAAAEKDSETLYSLKFHWKQASKKEKAAFLEWAATNK